MGERLVMQESLFYEFQLEDHVPSDHLLRRMVDFSYNPEADTYTYTEGKTLTTSGTVVNAGTTRLYRGSTFDCGPCPLKEQCCPNDLHGMPVTERPAWWKKRTIISGCRLRRPNSRRASRCRSSTEPGRAFAMARLTRALHCSSGFSSGA
jgi:hypothetical protein